MRFKKLDKKRLENDLSAAITFTSGVEPTTDLIMDYLEELEGLDLGLLDEADIINLESLLILLNNTTINLQAIRSLLSKLLKSVKEKEGKK